MARFENWRLQFIQHYSSQHLISKEFGFHLKTELLAQNMDINPSSTVVLRHLDKYLEKIQICVSELKIARMNKINFLLTYTYCRLNQLVEWFYWFVNVSLCSCYYLGEQCFHPGQV